MHDHAHFQKANFIKQNYIKLININSYAFLLSNYTINT